MAQLTIRGLPEEVDRALRAQAARHGRSMEAEVRLILRQALILPTETPMGEAMAAIWRQSGITDEEQAFLEGTRDRRPHEPMSFK
ncbi:MULTISPECIES: FitA-like ribbon-helix-helix domain-containing protein [Pseudomonas]|uniref:Arc family DNA-binding protein n=1 Tax=Pseudomonas flavocrustae TaxID=2991719 RepID=A0ABT6IM37_9PSED|nr:MULTISPECIES: Arc family DNA-binding protein [Pseudomonas]MDH4764925.1 Arc family DNA-binding protein [Pseudomonas sp. CBMAI 2609]MDK8262942.1 Arc family DNA-binding protein [Pseudomonas oryzihabitans]